MSGHNLPLTPAPTLTPLAFMQKWLPKLADNEFENIVEETLRELVLDLFGTFPTFGGLTVKNVKGAIYPVPFTDSLNTIPLAYRILGMEALARNGTDSSTAGAGVVQPPITYQLLRDSAGDVDALIDEELNTVTTVKARWVRSSGTAAQQIDSFPYFEQEDRTPSYQVGDRFSYQQTNGEWWLYIVKVAQGYYAASPTGDDNDPNYSRFSPNTNTSGASTFAQLTGDPLDNDALAQQFDYKANLHSPAFAGIPTGPTAALGTNTNQLATMAAVQAAIAALINGAPGALDTLKELADALANSNSALGALLTNVSGRLSIASNLADLASASAARSNLGLGNVNNTSDANKPVSTAQAAALEAVRTTLSMGSERLYAFTLVLADAGCVVALNSGEVNPVAVTVPTHAAVAFPLGTIISIRQKGVTQALITPAAGVTLRTYIGLKTPGQWAAVALHKVDTNEWIVEGGTN